MIKDSDIRKADYPIEALLCDCWSQTRAGTKRNTADQGISGIRCPLEMPTKEK
jgi:hypothetical protein